MINRLMDLINRAGRYLQEAETNPLPDVQAHYKRRAEREMRRIRRIKKLLG